MKATCIDDPIEGYGTLMEADEVRRRQGTGVHATYEYECAPCIAKAEGITEGEVLMKCKRSRIEKWIQRCDRFTFAKKHVQKMFPFAAEIKNGNKLTIEQTRHSLKTMATLFAPMMRILQIKLMDEELGLEACTKYKAWEAVHPEADDMEKGLQIDIELDAAMRKWRAFENKGENQTAYCAAADYSDEWFSD